MYTVNPSTQHLTALKHILHYLVGTKSYMLEYKVLPRPENFYGYADRAYKNADECKSTTRYVFMAGDGAITWNSKRQISRALLSTEAEYVALSKAVHEACWLRNLYLELVLLQKELPIEIKGNNKGSIAMANNPGFH